MRIAVTREVSSRIALCELTYQTRSPINLDLARAQHRQYEECLSSLGCSILRLPESPDLPDSVFVEDTAVVLDELALITRPGAESRRTETHLVAWALLPYRPLVFLEAPCILDGGDVLRLGKRLFVGLSRRSNREAIRQMDALLGGYGYHVAGIEIKGCLHLKSAVTQVAEDALLVNREWIDPAPFGPMKTIDVAPGEQAAANALMIADTVIFPQSYPETRKRLEQHGIHVRQVAVTELAKAEGGVTCCSLVFETSD